MYTLIIDNNEIELPNFSIDIAESLENAKVGTLREKAKKKYDVIRKLVGNKVIDAEIGVFAKADINKIETIFDDIEEVYNKESSTAVLDRINSKLSELNVDQFASMVDKLEKISNLEKKLK